MVREHDCEHYRKLLYSRGHGYPFWIPELSETLPDKVKAEGISVGDVGVLTDDGGFELLWNIHRAPDDPRNRGYELPHNFRPLDKDVNISMINYHSENAVIDVNVDKEWNSAVGAKMDPALVGGIVGGGAKFAFGTKGASGAVLVLPRGGLRVNAPRKGLYRQYARDHAKSWYQHVNGVLGLDVPSGALYLVTGTDKCSSWGAVSFSKHSKSHSFSLDFSASSIANVGLSYARSSSTEFTPVHRGEALDPSQKSLCVFARGYVINVRDNVLARYGLWPARVTELSGGRKSLPSLVSSKPPYAGRIDSSAILSNASQDRIVTPGGEEQSNKDPGAPIAIVHDNPGAHAVIVHDNPATIMGNEEFKKNADASFVIVHDDAWITAMNEHKLSEASDSEDGLLTSLTTYAASLPNEHVTNGVCVMDSPSRIFALLIGINVYEQACLPTRQGAVADAMDMMDFLTQHIDMDPSRAYILLNCDATHDRILKAFSALISDPRIWRGDPIVIFYAGHSCPAVGSDAHTVIVPHDFLPSASSNGERRGILEVTLAQLLSELAMAKSDNITVILDAPAFSPRTPRRMDYPMLPEGLQGGRPGDRDAQAAISFYNSQFAPYMLLKEHSGRGRFTQALLALLRNVLNAGEVTDSHVIEFLPEWPDLARMILALVVRVRQTWPRVPQHPAGSGSR